MCVLTYIPQSNGLVTITHNRDEHHTRPTALPPTEYVVGSEKVVFPKDPQGEGTWFAVHQDWICCMLNGAYQLHERKASYRQSRGQVILSFMQCLDIQIFVSKFDAYNMEPFTFIAFDLKRQKVHQVIWDEKTLNLQSLSEKTPYIWSSVTLYDSKIRAMRQQMFDQFLVNKPKAQAIFDFHQLNAKDSLGNGFFVNIDNRVHTVAITQVTGKYGEMELKYKDFR
jgi:uncharacterized protein with NRDE domain